MKLTEKLDKFGQALSAVCLVHCLLLPILLATIPFVGFLGMLHTPFAENLMIFLAIVNAVIAVTSGLKKHKNYIVLAIFLSGSLMFLLNYLFRSVMNSYDIFTPLGAFLIGTGHLMNNKLCNSCSRCKNHE